MSEYTRVEQLRLLHHLFPTKYAHPDDNHEHEWHCDPIVERLGFERFPTEDTDE